MSEELHPGQSIGGYVLEQRLGGGGFGAVWKAREGQSGRMVAVKVLRTDAYSTDTLKLRSEVELLAATAASRSPHVVKVLGGGVEPQPYIVMEFIDGVDLGRELERRKRIPQTETIRIGKAVAEALSALETVGIIHRDVKPTNVMIDVDGVIKLTDFGIAKIVGFDTITATSQMPMTMAYAAPEVWEGKASNRSDIYALGVILFQCLAGRPPFTGSPAQLFREHTTKDPDYTLLPEGTVPALRDLLRDCLAKSESDRPPNAGRVAEELCEAERELNARVQSNGSIDLPVHEPTAFGPWLRQEPHPTQPWAFRCIHETSGEKATVEIHFSDDIEYGARLRKAVEVNPKLVPLGAERLLGTNRLVLRPGEAWTNPPTGQLQFWVAREELPLCSSPSVVDEPTLRKVVTSLVGIRALGNASGVPIRLPGHALSLLANGQVHLMRPALWETGDNGMTWVRGLPLVAGLADSLRAAKDLQDLSGSVGVAAEKAPGEPVHSLGHDASSAFSWQGRFSTNWGRNLSNEVKDHGPKPDEAEAGSSAPSSLPPTVRPRPGSSLHGRRSLVVGLGVGVSIVVIIMSSSLWVTRGNGGVPAEVANRVSALTPIAGLTNTEEIPASVSRSPTGNDASTPSAPAAQSPAPVQSSSEGGAATAVPTSSSTVSIPSSPTSSSTVAATAVPTLGGVLSDDFSNAAGGLMVAYAGDGRSVQYAGGVLLFEQSVPSERVGAGSKAQFSNAVIEFEIAFIGSPAQLVVAADCRSQGNSPGGYGVRVDASNRTYKLVVGRPDGSYFDATPMVSNTAINATGSNRVHLSCIGDRIAASVNGSSELSTTDATWKSGWFQLTIQNFRLMPEVRASMDNLKITIQ